MDIDALFNSMLDDLRDTWRKVSALGPYGFRQEDEMRKAMEVWAAIKHVEDALEKLKKAL